MTKPIPGYLSILGFLALLLALAAAVGRCSKHLPLAAPGPVASAPSTSPGLPPLCEGYLKAHAACLASSPTIKDRGAEEALVHERQRSYLAVARASHTEQDRDALERNCRESQEVLSAWCPAAALPTP